MGKERQGGNNPCAMEGLCDATGPNVYRRLREAFGKHPTVVKRKCCSDGGSGCPILPDLQQYGENSKYSKPGL